MDPLRTEMFQVAVGYWLSKALFCAARAGVADELKAGPRPVGELATAARVDAENLYRVLRALASTGIFEETEPGVVGLTPRAEYLREDHPQSMKHFALMVGDDLFDVWCDLYHAVETGQSAVQKRFGRDFFSEIGKDLQKSRVFDRAMQEIHGGETDMMLEHFDFSGCSTVLDVGGGNGSTLRGILEAHPHLRGALFDLPQVVANARRLLEGSGLAGRVELHAGDFFEEIPGRADCIVLRHVLHDWDDERSATILGNARRALDERGSLLIVEKVITPGNEPGFVKLLDLNMMAIGGRERTEAQYRALLEKAGLRLERVLVTPGPIDVIEGRL
jgi:SAM-dependent methyltransferase